MPNGPARRVGLNRPLFLLLLASFGALALVGQVVLLRQLLAVFQGNELIVALVWAGWLAGVFVGARLAGLVKFKPGTDAMWLAAVPVAWVGVLGLLLTLSYLVPGLTGLAVGETAPFETAALWTFLLTAPASAFAGFLFVLAGSYYHQRRKESGESPGGVGGAIFWAETAGSCLGLLIYTFFLVGRVGPMETLAFFSLAAIGLLGPALARSRIMGLAVAGIALVAGLGFHYSGLAETLDREANRVRFTRSFPAYELLEARDTPYQHLALAGREGETALFGNRIFMASWPDPYRYNQLTYFFLTEAAQYRRVLLAGQGPGGFIHEFLKTGVERLVYVALDPDETDMIARRLPPEMRQDLTDPRLTIIHDDVRRYVERTGETFDLILINAPDPDNAQINRLYTLEFYRAARALLSEQGVLITSISGADNYWSEELLGFGYSLYRTLRAVFPEVLVTPGDVHYFLAGAQPGLASDDPEELGRRFEERGFSSPYLTPRSIRLFFPPTGSEYIKTRLAEAERSGAARINTDATPLCYFLRLIWWEKMTGSGWTRAFLAGAMNIGAWGSAAAVLLIIPLLLTAWRPRPASAAVRTIAATGAVTMALQIVLIFIYQNEHGVLYRQIGLISALFMGGLAVGGFLGRGIVARGFGKYTIVLLEIGLTLAAALTALTARGNLPGLVLPLTALTGLISGAQFSVFFALLLTDPGRPSVERGLTRFEAADHGGAMLGAMATGLILVPVAGLAATALVLAGYKLLSAAALLRLGR